MTLVNRCIDAINCSEQRKEIKLLLDDLLDFFIKWLTAHIKVEDKLIAAYSNGKEELIEQSLLNLRLNSQSSNS